MPAVMACVQISIMNFITSLKKWSGQNRTSRTSSYAYDKIGRYWVHSVAETAWTLLSAQCCWNSRVKQTHAEKARCPAAEVVSKTTPRIGHLNVTALPTQLRCVQWLFHSVFQWLDTLTTACSGLPHNTTQSASVYNDVNKRWTSLWFTQVT